MLNRKFRKKGLINFRYKETQWYNTIRSETRSYKIQVLLFVLCASLIIPVSFVVSRSDQPELLPLAVSGAVFAVLAAELVFFLKFRRLRIMIWLLLVQILIGLVVSLFIHGGYALALLLMSASPMLATQLRGSVKGGYIFGTTLVVFLLVYMLQALRVVPRIAPAFTLLELSLLLVTGATVFILCFYTERRQEALVARFVDLLVFDDSTGLPNKDVLYQSIEPDRKYLLAIIKIENFSDLVALFGYEFSNIISQFASQKLRKYEQRYSYTTYQLKYNEYGLLVETGEHSKTDEAAAKLGKILKSLELESLPWERDRIKLVYRVGGAIITPEDRRSPLSKADVALKKAERGHSAITMYDDDNDERESAYEYVIRFTELLNNRENDTFRTVFQPVFSSDGSGIVWYEALLRIKQQSGEYTSIYPYLGVAKSTGFYQHLTDFVLKKSAEAICTHDVDVSVNISIHDIVRPEFIALVDDVYEQICNKNGRIIFEILESDEMVEMDKCLQFIEYIGRYGFKIAIDDFGTGYSNYCNLINLPVDIVKIDGSLIRKIHSDETAKMLVEGIIHFCQKSNKKTVAEYVENIQIFESLKSMNIDFLQGYYLSLPAEICNCPCLAESGDFLQLA